ncbi:MAG: formylglycine-generating enzyme family protein [Bacteroidales bacterium]|nr:formylglycine-generating enzyme family protein [Bacteroidales bacterium]
MKKIFLIIISLLLTNIIKSQNLDIIENVNGCTFKMIYVKGGLFKMGAQNKSELQDNYDVMANEDESPVHVVTLKDYYIGQYEVTQKLWKAVMGTNPSIIQNENNPVEKISWFDAQDFIKKLNKLTGKKYRLPTEEEWEYAAKGGIKSKGYRFSGSNNLDEVAWNAHNTEALDDKYPCHSVGLLKPNELGIYDMSGNAFEWCQNYYYGDYSVKNKKTTTMVNLRGGSSANTEYNCRISARTCFTDISWAYFIGMRLVLEK